MIFLCWLYLAGGEQNTEQTVGEQEPFQDNTNAHFPCLFTQNETALQLLLLDRSHQLHHVC